MVSFISPTHTSQGHATLSVLTFNCYGLKSSLNYAKELMNTNDVIFLNEHWLMDSDILVIKAILSEYDVYIKSSMDGESNACGRPFGGIGFICKQKAGVIPPSHRRRGATTVLVKTAISVVTPPVVLHSSPTRQTCVFLRGAAEPQRSHCGHSDPIELQLRFDGGATAIIGGMTAVLAAALRDH